MTPSLCVLIPRLSLRFVSTSSNGSTPDPPANGLSKNGVQSRHHCSTSIGIEATSCFIANDTSKLAILLDAVRPGGAHLVTMEGRRPATLGVSVTFFVIASIFVVLRFISRVFVVRKVGLHDYLMLVAWVVDFGFSFSLFYATKNGLGLHSRDVLPENEATLNKANYAFTVLYNPALMAVKTSILVFYLTLTRNQKVSRWANYVTLAVVNAAGLALTMVNVFQCRPVSAAFLSSIPSYAHCTDILTLYLSSSPVNIITDLAILFLPMPILTHMRLPYKQKVILVITFSFGFFVAVVDVIRIAFLQQAATSRSLALKSIHLQNVGGGDFSWFASLSFMWSVVEVNVSIICGCVPSLKPLVARLMPKLIRDTDDVSYSSPRYNYATGDSPVAVPPPIAIPESAGPLPSLSPGESTGSKASQHRGDSTASHHPSADAPMSILDFLGRPGVDPQDAEANTHTSVSYPPDITFFDFVNMKNPESMLKLNNRESIAPIALTTLLFFLWGFAYGLLDILNTQFQIIVNLDSWHSLGLHGAYFGGYVVGPLLIGQPVLKVWGFKSTFMTGLCIYACGTLIFWPSAVLTSTTAFTVSNFIVGLGLAVLETAANPFIALCGPLENSEIRLNISQGVQAVGSVLSPLLAKKVLFKGVQDVASLVDVQWTYLGIALFDVLLAVVFYYLPIPEASDEDLEELANRRRGDNMAKVLGIPVVWLTLGLGIWSQFFYVAGQEVLSTSLERFTIAVHPDSSLGSFEFVTIGHSVFAVGRFLAAFAQWFLKPRWILMLSYIGMVVFSVLCMYTTGSAAIVMAMLVYLFESGAFSIIFALSLRGTARHTKTAAVFLTVAVSGGVYFPFAEYAAYLARGASYSFCVLVALFAAGAVFPLYLNLVPAVKKQVDPVPNEYLRRHRRRSRTSVQSVRREKENPSVGGVLSRHRSLVSNPDHLPDLPIPGETHQSPVTHNVHLSNSSSRSRMNSQSSQGSASHQRR
ncbi:Major facilitator superfamily domain general substrate transporter [Penicillium hispanicum]|uniref:Major facilitator superfamily domain general substrate transporter n=1 Tax=Penicillium hispanicum TaxID=1080232 RepID=UPI002540137E|nr:Major facilitator superfamily domain general substrate transporter [Penicillium hispanicum]KAJ5570470.1 Major facilitator superfamily domain general substrate transporter [Penicillium hispanicum]